MPFALSSGLVCPLWVLSLALVVLVLLCFFLLGVIRAPQELLEWSRCLHDCLPCHVALQLLVVFGCGFGVGFSVALRCLWWLLLLLLLVGFLCILPLILPRKCFVLV